MDGTPRTAQLLLSQPLLALVGGQTFLFSGCDRIGSVAPRFGSTGLDAITKRRKQPFSFGQGGGNGRGQAGALLSRAWCALSLPRR